MDKQEQEHKEEKQEQEHKEEKQEQEQPNEHEQEKELGKEHELQHTNPSPDPPPKQNSPAREPELLQTCPSSPPKQSSPPRLPYHNSTPKSPPLGEEEEEDNIKPPFKLLPPPAVAAAVGFETKVEPTSQEVQDEENGLGGGGDDGHGHGDGFVNTGSGRKHLKTNLSILKKTKRDSMMKRALIVSRISGFVFSLVSFSVLAADRDRGWAIDSFYRYKEFRYCMAVNVIAFVYSGFQGYDLIYQLTSGEREVRQPLRHYLDFSLDQAITYLLISASSSAAVRVDDWQSNWGKDPFPDMARASVALSFFAFVALALSSLVSGYKVYTLKSL